MQPERDENADSSQTRQTDASDGNGEGGASAKPAERASLVIARPGAFLALVILSCFGAGYAIYWLLRTMHI